MSVILDILEICWLRCKLFYNTRRHATIINRHNRTIMRAKNVFMRIEKERNTQFKLQRWNDYTIQKLNMSKMNIFRSMYVLPDDLVDVVGQYLG